MKFYKVTLDTPYSGTDSVEYISAESEREARREL